MTEDNTVTATVIQDGTADAPFFEETGVYSRVQVCKMDGCILLQFQRAMPVEGSLLTFELSIWEGRLCTGLSLSLEAASVLYRLLGRVLLEKSDDAARGREQ